MSIALYPIGVVFAVSLLAAGVCWAFSGPRWGRTMAVVGFIQAVGLVVVSRAMFATSRLFPEQLFPAFITIAITTKVAVFSPIIVGRVGNPLVTPTVTKRDLTVGIAGSWLIQSSLGLLYLFPDTHLQALQSWVMPTSAVNIFVWPLLTGFLVVQVTMAGRLFEAWPGGSPDANAATETDTVETNTVETPDSDPIGSVESPAEAGGSGD